MPRKAMKPQRDGWSERLGAVVAAAHPDGPEVREKGTCSRTTTGHRDKAKPPLLTSFPPAARRLFFSQPAVNTPTPLLSSPLLSSPSSSRSPPTLPSVPCFQSSPLPPAAAASPPPI